MFANNKYRTAARRLFIIALSLFAAVSLLSTGALALETDGSVPADAGLDFQTIKDIINNAEGTVTITLDDDIHFDETLIIPMGGNVTIRSAAGQTYSLIKSDAGRHFSVNGRLTLTGVTLDGSGAGGGINISGGGTLTVGEGAVITRCSSANGGGVYANAGASLTIEGDGAVHKNHAADDGGGIYMDGGALSMRDTGSVTENTADNGGGLYIGGGISANITGNNKINGNTASESGGGIYSSPGATGGFKIDSGEISNNTAAANGAGLYLGGITFTAADGNISTNTAGGSGGGVYIESGDFILDGCEISNNTAGVSGGGLYNSGGELNLGADGIISGNKSTADGGGLYLEGGSFGAAGGKIEGNTAGENGGGIYNTAGVFEMTGGTVISGNKAAVGGAIYSAALSDIITASETVFMNNKASSAHEPPAAASEEYSAIGFASASIYSHPLNNYDINYTEGTGKFAVRYYGNGAESGEVPSDQNLYGEGERFKVLENTGILARSGYAFDGWKAEADGILLNPGDEVEMGSGDAELHAQWVIGSGEIGTHTKYIFGYPDGNFQPGDNMTRAEGVAMIVRSFLNEIETDADPEDYGFGGSRMRSGADTDGFTDVDENAWYFIYIKTALETGIIEMTGDRLFRPDDPITMADFEQIASAAEDISGENDPGGELSQITKEGAALDGKVTRAQAVHMINRMLGRITADESFEEVEYEVFPDVPETNEYYHDIIESNNTHEYYIKDQIEIWVG